MSNFSIKLFGLSLTDGQVADIILLIELNRHSCSLKRSNIFAVIMNLKAINREPDFNAIKHRNPRRQAIFRFLSVPSTSLVSFLTLVLAEVKAEATLTC